MIRKFFSPPVFESDADNFRAKFINGFAWFGILALIFAIASGGLNFRANTTDAVLLGLVGVLGLALYFLHKGSINTSGSIIIVLGWLGLT
jgi:hypothetical protein